MDHRERQIAETLDGIRADHLNRYKWASSILPEGHVFDACSGIGYGSYVLAQQGFDVYSVELDHEAVEYGNSHYSHPNINRKRADIRDVSTTCNTVMFECIEHILNPQHFIRNMGNILLASVPNEAIVHYNSDNKYHHRHYTKEQFNELLESCGYTVKSWYGQKDIFSDVEQDIEGQTLIAYAVR